MHTGSVNPTPVAVTGTVGVSGTVPVSGPLTDAQLRAAAVSTEPYYGINLDASARTRVSSLTTLFDGKELNAEETLLWDNKGTGTKTFANSVTTLAVTSGQYYVKQSKFFHPYMSGKSQLIEMTFDTFAAQTGVVKRFGYYSSSAVAPYDTVFDGWYVESGSGTYKLNIVNAGTTILSLDWTLWDGYASISGYDWNDFTVTLVDFLWLGGAVLRLFLKNPNGGFTLCHTFNYAGTAAGPFMKSPQQPVRYELRGVSGAGSFRPICSQVATEGAIVDKGQTNAVFTTTTIACNAIGVIYAIRGIRASATYRDQAVHIESFDCAIAGVTADSGMILLLLNPTLSAPLTWSAVGRFEDGVATNQTITAGTGTLLAATAVVSSARAEPVAENILSGLPVDIDNTMGQMILAYVPYTANQAIAGSIQVYRN